MSALLDKVRELEEQKNKLEKAIIEARKEAKKEALSLVKKLIQDNGFTHNAVFPLKPWVDDLKKKAEKELAKTAQQEPHKTKTMP